MLVCRDASPQTVDEGQSWIALMECKVCFRCFPYKCVCCSIGYFGLNADLKVSLKADRICNQTMDTSILSHFDCCSTQPFPSGSEKVAKLPQGAFLISLIYRPFSLSFERVCSTSSVSNSSPCTEPAGMASNHVTRVMEISAPLGRN